MTHAVIDKMTRKFGLPNRLEVEMTVFYGPANSHTFKHIYSIKDREFLSDVGRAHGGILTRESKARLIAEVMSLT